MTASKIAAYEAEGIVFVVAAEKVPADVTRITLREAEEILGKTEFNHAADSARTVASLLCAGKNA